MKCTGDCRACRVHGGTGPVNKEREMLRLSAIINRRLKFFQSKKITSYEKNKIAAAAAQTETLRPGS